MSKLLILIFIAELLIVSCSRTTPEYYTTVHGLKYKYHDISDEDRTPQRGDYLSVFMEWKLQNDSVFYSSFQLRPNGVDIIKIGKPEHLGGIEEAFTKIKKGDSVSFYIEPQRFYEDYLKVNRIPDFLQGEKEMIITIRLLDVQSATEYKKWIISRKEELELQELKEVSNIVKKWESEHDSIKEINGSFLVLEKKTKEEPLKYGAIINLHYTASFVNGKTFYSTYQNGYPDEFQVGTEGQMVEGLKDALLHMKYGEKAKVLVPSYRGFGSEGSVGHTIPPFTPIIYRIEVLSKDYKI